jgi:hypothetical protein
VTAADDPFLIAMERQTDGLQTILRRIDELQEIMNRLFSVLRLFETRLHHVEAEHERLLADRPDVPPPRAH